MTITYINVMSIGELSKQRETKQQHGNPESAPEINANKWPETMESLLEYLCHFCGINDIPIEYVVRSYLLKEDEGNKPFTNYDTLYE